MLAVLTEFYFIHLQRDFFARWAETFPGQASLNVPHQDKSPQPTISDITTLVNGKSNVDMLCLTSFSLSSQCWPRTWTSPPKNGYKTTLEERRQVPAKLSVKDCSLLDSRSLCRHVTPLPTGEEEQTTHNPVTLEDKECDVTLPNCLA